MKVKVCGMREAENIRAVARLNPDLMGFIFYRQSPRFVGDDFELPQDFPTTIQRVGVFVNETESVVLQQAKHHHLDAVQVHGDEDTDYCAALKRAGLTVIKVFRIDAEFDFRSTAPFSSVADLFLFDTKGKWYGGNAQPFDWNLLKQYGGPVPFLLSGGLHPQNLADIKLLNNHYLAGVDVNSGVEQQPGIKDATKVSEAIKAVHL